MADKEEIKEQEAPEKEEKEEKKGKKNKKEKKEKKEKKGEKDDKKTETDEKKSLIARLLPKVIIVVIVGVFAGAGFTLARLLAGSPASQTNEGAEQAQSENMDTEDSEDGTQGSWYYHLEPVIANLDVDDVTRYVKASLTLEVSIDVDEKEGTVFIDQKKPVLTNWLTVYLASLHLDDIRGDSNLKRIQSQVMDAFNEKLFPDSKPKIKNVLFKEFAVQ
ncbi:MAG: flagellar basal body-associated FliL family protein [Planctomycetes bacterium]|nr:flagellar basal body-associated FliL family protein [Planctomycetota bacterium]